MKLIYKYDDIFESWIFTTQERVDDYMNIFKAFESKTWGEFRAILPKDDYEWISEILIEEAFEMKLEENEFFKPSDNAPFTQSQWLVDSLEYPTYMVWDNEDHLPADVLQKYGEEIVTVHDGSYFQLPKPCLFEVLASLKEKGIECTSREDLPFACQDVG